VSILEVAICAKRKEIVLRAGKYPRASPEQRKILQELDWHISNCPECQAFIASFPDEDPHPEITLGLNKPKPEPVKAKPPAPFEYPI
jgi:hypothetical protein